ncbi:protein THEMIS2 isoform X2 [Bufo bufo]|uniref:protein THEMIS2 isoform X2 n=1 Tax=Bufo bufo TaxID=8384 RepID=UPI001ABE6090|nr:protein THEMIS2 isoform X2 [Bufo bufo]
MDNLENAVSLNDFIASIPVSSLPRILQITSGVYLQSVFQVSADNSVYDTLGELHQKLSCDEYSHVWFTSESEFTVGKHIIRKRLPIQLLSVDRNTNCGECYIFEGSDSYNIKIPLSTKGLFLECEDNEVYTVEQIIQDPGLSKRNFKCTQIGTGEYRLCPEYEIKTVMHMRKGFVKMPSSLEVDVVDITAHCGNITFLQPLSLTDVFYQQKFPIVAEILDAADFQHLVKNDTYSALQKGQKIIIYRKTVSKKVLATGIKGKTSKFFYIYDSYQGKFRQRPREFDSIFELWTKAVEGTKLKVVVIQDCDSGEENFPSLCIGDHLQVLYNTKTVLTTPGGPQETDVLVCNKGTAEDGGGDDDDDDNEKPEEVMLPIYMEGRFVEEIKDTKKYNLSNIILKLKLPCEVKVVTKDTCLSNDPLASFPSIRLEEIMEESSLLVSLYDKASECFELPVKYFDISVVLLEEKVASPAGLTNSTKVEELMECFYYNLRKDLPSHQHPPPRPPKREVKAREKVSCSKSLRTKKTLPPKPKKSETMHSHGLSGHNKMSHGSKKMSEIDNGQNNMYSTTPRRNTVSVSGTDSDDDYEQIDDQICHLNLSSKVNL